MGELFAGGTARPAMTEDLALYERMRQLQAQQPVPVLQHRSNPHEYLFIALFDGTGQDVNNPDQLPTNIGTLKKQLDGLKDQPELRVAGKYVAGIGTQQNPITRTLDGAFAYTW